MKVMFEKEIYGCIECPYLLRKYAMGAKHNLCTHKLRKDEDLDGDVHFIDADCPIAYIEKMKEKRHDKHM